MDEDEQTVMLRSQKYGKVVDLISRREYIPSVSFLKELYFQMATVSHRRMQKASFLYPIARETKNQDRYLIHFPRNFLILFSFLHDLMMTYVSYLNGTGFNLGWEYKM